MIDISTDPDYAKAFDDDSAGDQDNVDPVEETRFFMNYIDDVQLRIILYQATIQQFKNLFIVDPTWSLSSTIRIVDDAFSSDIYEHVNAHLRRHQTVLERHLADKLEIRNQLFLLKLISFLVPLLIAMRKRMRIPDLNRILPNMTGRSYFFPTFED